MPDLPPPTPRSALHLLGERRFAPFFWTQFLGAANDNVFKLVVTLLLTYQLQTAWLPPAQAGLVIGAVFILPFVLFSATAGQLADRLPQHRLMQAVKSTEVGIAVLGGLGLLWPSVPLMLLGIFLMGLHSTVFGPVKYAYLPAHLQPRELVGGNGLVEMGTFVAILLGNLLAGLLMAWPAHGVQAAALACLLLALLGRWAAHGLPATPAAAPDLRLDWNLWRETTRNLRLARQDGAVFGALLGISWLWFVGAVLLGNFPALAKDVLHGDASVATALLLVFSVGIALGSLACERLAGGQIDLRVVVGGAAGMAVFGFDLYRACASLPPGPGPDAAPLLGLGAFLAQAAHARVLADLALLAACAGLYSVPLYALFQQRAPHTHRARIVAANNILNALFMIAASLLAGQWLATGGSVPGLLGALAGLNAVLALGLGLRLRRRVRGF